MLGIQKVLTHGGVLKNAVLQHIRLVNPVVRPLVFPRYESSVSARVEEHGFESTTISDILKSKGKNADGSWLWCSTDDTVYDAVKSMTQHNVGALVVVNPGEQKSLAGIITERDYLRKIIVQGRSSKSTKVGDIMTEEFRAYRPPLQLVGHGFVRWEQPLWRQGTLHTSDPQDPAMRELFALGLHNSIGGKHSNKLITVTPDTKVLKAMQLMTDNRIRHIPVVLDNEGMIGMVSIGDVVRAVVSEHREELERLNAYIHGTGY